MLASDAQRLYWFARYMERTWCTAELLSAYTQFVLDSALTSPPRWDVLVHITDGEEDFKSRYADYTEDSVLRYLISDRDNPGSLESSIASARENIRRTRDHFPVECWEVCNALKIAVERIEGRTWRFGNFDEILAATKEYEGIVQNSLCHDHGYSFLHLGKYIERADMISRTIDTFVLTAIAQGDEFEATLWLWPNLLKSVQSQSAFRRLTRSPLVATEDINAAMQFLFAEKTFPRSLLFCVQMLAVEVKRLDKSSAILEALGKIAGKLEDLEPEALTLAKINKTIDRFQEDLAKVHNDIYQRWFG